MANVSIESSWQQALSDEFSKPYFESLIAFVKEEYQNSEVFPPGSKIFNAFNHCPINQVKVVILGQDPYHGPGQANGLCFSVAKGVKSPPSLQNIFKELQADVGVAQPNHGDLSSWCTQGVFLLNATLTVRARTAGSHQNKGWEEFTDAVIRELNNRREGLVYILWGAYAQKKGAIIDKEKNLVIKSAHPSPFAAHRGFFGSRPFSKCNDYLRSKNQQEIDWDIK